MMRIRTAVMAVVLLVVATLSAEAQVQERQWQVVVGGGYQSFGSGAAVDPGAVLSGEANYFFSEVLAVGLYTDFIFTQTSGDELIPAALPFVDSTTFTFINQAMEIFQYGVQTKVRLPRNFSPYALLGVGGYTAFFDPQQNNGNSNSTRWAMKFGVGVDLAVSSGAGFQLVVQDSWYPNWDPTALLPVRPQFQNTQFPELNPDQSELSSSVHNFSFKAAFTLVPGAL